MSDARPAVLAVVALGGALGAAARYGVARLAPVEAGAFPWATLAVNVTGALALGAVTTLLARWAPATRHRYARPFLTTGLLGAYTTWSALAVEADLLVADGRPATAALYVAATFVLGVPAAWLGIRAGGRPA